MWFVVEQYVEKITLNFLALWEKCGIISICVFKMDIRLLLEDKWLWQTYCYMLIWALYCSLFIKNTEDDIDGFRIQ